MKLSLSSPSSTSVSQTPSTVAKDDKNKGFAEMKDSFTKLDVNSKTLLFEATQLVRVFRNQNVDESHDHNGQSKSGVEDEEKIFGLISQIRSNLEEMSGMAEDMEMIQGQRITSPRIVDQAKTFRLSVDGLRTSFRSLQRDFHLAKSAKERQDLFSLSRSPFDQASGARRRATTAAEISSGATESMLNSRRILLETVQRSAGAMNVLASSSGAIGENVEELKGQNVLISTSRKLLTKYGRREFTDKILICLGLIFFLACVVYVVQKRLF